MQSTTLTNYDGPVLKEFALTHKSGSLGDNQLSVVASSTGNIDLIGDVLAHGAFSKAVLSKCEDEGWMDAGHSWSEMVGYNDALKIINNELHWTSTFHTTQKAQDLFTVVKERLAAGKKVSCSIGFMPDYSSVKGFENGAAMVKHLEENGGTDGYDVLAIRAWKGFCRLIEKVRELYENSIVNIGANPRAHAYAAKAFLKHFSGEETALGLSLSDRITRTLGSVGDLTNDLEIAATQREANGRTLSKSHEPTIKELIERLTVIHQSLQPDEPEQAPITDELRFRALKLRASQLAA